MAGLDLEALFAVPTSYGEEMTTSTAAVLLVALAAVQPGSAIGAPFQGPAQQASVPPSQAGTPPSQAAAQPPADPPALEPGDLPVSVDRIQKALSQPAAIRLDTGRPVFRTEVIARRPSVEDLLGRDFAKGPANYGAMTHQDFLNLVTPNDVRGYSAFTNSEALVVAATSLGLQWALRRAVQLFNDARTERERENARREVDEALRELDRARARAGLPPRAGG